jgi:hypothetical protein
MGFGPGCLAKVKYMGFISLALLYDCQFKGYFIEEIISNTGFWS